MRSPERWAIAVRRPDGAIHTEMHPVNKRRSGAPAPLIRGVAALAEAISIGVEGLRVSVRESTGIAPTSAQMRSTLITAGAGLITLLVVAPGVLSAAWPDRLGDILEASSRAAVVLVYLFAVSRSAGARRLFGYHGAEHKVIAAFERHGDRPTIDQAERESPIHARCGTNFLSLFVIVTGVLFAFVPREPLWAGACLRLALAPVAAAIAYELIRTIARHERSALARSLSAPGRALQRITTRPPDPEQLAVAMAAFAALSG